ncbi:MAG: hypothetical protein FWD09_01055 [Lentimicrobiaceae bacterium]|nr:hypothetical protein [Lentimicrobiaceae bacterium]
MNFILYFPVTSNGQFCVIAALPSSENITTFARRLLRGEVCESRHLIKPPARCANIAGRDPLKRTNHRKENTGVLRQLKQFHFWNVRKVFFVECQDFSILNKCSCSDERIR